MNVKLILTIAISTMFFIGCGSESTNPTNNFSGSPVTDTSKTNLHTQFFNMSLLKEEWNNGIYGGGTVYGPLGAGKNATYYNPTMDNPIMVITEQSYEDDCNKTQFREKIEKYKTFVSKYEPTDFEWKVLEEKEDSLLVKWSCNDSSLGSTDFLSVLEIIKFTLKNQKLYRLSYTTEKNQIDTNEINLTKWTNFIKEATIK